jgi:hypothetical protein
MKKKPKMKWIMKIKLTTHPKIKTKIDKATTIISIILAILFTIGIAYLLINTFLIKHAENPIPTQKEIDEICNSKNMSSYGYIIKYHDNKTLKSIDEEQTYILCKTLYKATNQNLTLTYYSYCPNGTIYKSVPCECYKWGCLMECFICVNKTNATEEWLYQVYEVIQKWDK